MGERPRRNVRRPVAAALILILVSPSAASAGSVSPHRDVLPPAPPRSPAAAAAFDAPDVPPVPTVTIAANAIVAAPLPDPPDAGAARHYHVPVLMYLLDRAGLVLAIEVDDITVGKNLAAYDIVVNSMHFAAP